MNLKSVLALGVALSLLAAVSGAEAAKVIDFVNRGTGSDAGNASIVITLSETPTKLYFAQGENGGWTVSDGTACSGRTK